MASGLRPKALEACLLAETARTPNEVETAHKAMREAFPMLAAAYPCYCDACRPRCFCDEHRKERRK